MKEDYVILKKVCSRIQYCLSAQCKSEALRLSDVYDHIRRVEELKEVFATPILFSRFMRRMHNEGILKQFITNFNVDTANHRKYQWYFYPKEVAIQEDRSLVVNNSLTTIYNAPKFMKWGLKYEANNGLKVRSMDEQYILNLLLNEKDFSVEYEKLFVKKNRQKIYPDFKVTNINSGRVFIWEHFGFINNVNYSDDMVEKITYYKAKGYKNIDDGSKFVFIATINKNPFQFTKLVEGIIDKMKKC